MAAYMSLMLPRLSRPELSGCSPVGDCPGKAARLPARSMCGSTGRSRRRARLPSGRTVTRSTPAPRLSRLVQEISPPAHSMRHSPAQGSSAPG